MAQIEEDIKIAVSKLARRINIHHTAGQVSVFMLWEAAIAVIVVIIGKFAPVSIPMIFAIITVLCVGMFAGLVRGMMNRVSAIEAAKIAKSSGKLITFDLDIPASDFIEDLALATMDELEEMISLCDLFIPCIGGAKDLTNKDNPLDMAVALLEKYTATT